MSETNTTETDDGEPLYARVPWRRVASIAAVLVLVAVVVPFVIYGVPQLVGGDGSYIVLSGSMEPHISAGDVIVTERVEASQIEEGDVITFRRDGDSRPTTHRVVGVTEQEGGIAFQTKGDANEDPDQQVVTPGEIEGKVMTIGGHLFVIPYLGYAITFAGTQSGFIALFVLPIVLFVGSEIWSVASSTRGGEDADTAGEDDEEAAAESEDTDSDGDSEAGEGDGDEDEAAAEEDEAVTFTAPELQLGLIILGLFVAYSFWVSYTTLEVWAFAVSGGVTTAFILLGAVYVLGGGTEAAEAEESGGEEGTEESAATPESALLEGDTEALGVLFEETDDPRQEIAIDSTSHVWADIATAPPGPTEPHNRGSISNREDAVEGESDD